MVKFILLETTLSPVRVYTPNEGQETLKGEHVTTRSSVYSVVYENTRTAVRAKDCSKCSKGELGRNPFGRFKCFESFGNPRKHPKCPNGGFFHPKGPKEMAARVQCTRVRRRSGQTFP